MVTATGVLPGILSAEDTSTYVAETHNQPEAGDERSCAAGSDSSTNGALFSTTVGLQNTESDVGRRSQTKYVTHERQDDESRPDTIGSTFPWDRDDQFQAAQLSTKFPLIRQNSIHEQPSLHSGTTSVASQHTATAFRPEHSSLPSSSTLQHHSNEQAAASRAGLGASDFDTRNIQGLQHLPNPYGGPGLINIPGFGLATGTGSSFDPTLTSPMNQRQNSDFAAMGEYSWSLPQDRDLGLYLHTLC